MKASMEDATAQPEESRKEETTDREPRSGRTEMEEMKEENRRLREFLNQLTRDYELLRTKVDEVNRNRSEKEPVDEADHDLISLSLGRSKRSGSDHSQDQQPKKKLSRTREERTGKVDGDDGEEASLALGLDCKFDSSPKPNDDANGSSSVNPSVENSSELVGKEGVEEATVTWPPNKAVKTTKNEDQRQLLDPNPVKKPRVSVRARCDTPTINDGCQWRKYGQKTAKGNPCPRAYYRCTVAPSCPVRKHVQRVPEDTSILITTYEGSHNHPLPLSATAMASTTSAAASMLLSGSTSSATNSALRGAHLFASDYNPLRPNQFYFPTSSSSHPTITIDLADSFTNSASMSYPSSSSLLSQFPSNGIIQGYPASSKSLNFGSSSMEAKESFFWGGRNNILLGYAANNSVSQTLPLSSSVYNPTFGNSTKDVVHQSLIQKQSMNPSFQQSLPAETIKAITSNPNFRSALAAALNSVIGNGGSDPGNAKLEQKHKPPAEPFSSLVANNISENYLSTAKSTGFGLGLGSKSSSSLLSSSHQQWSLMNSRPLLNYSGSKGSSASLGDARE